MDLLTQFYTFKVKVLGEEQVAIDRAERLKRLDPVEVRKLLDQVREPLHLNSREAAINRALWTVKRFMASMELVNGLWSFDLTEPAHGRGHMMRDCINGLRLAEGLECDWTELYLGLVAGMLHDIGNVVVPRYQDADRGLVKHAEVGALLFDEVMQGETRARLMHFNEILLICYAIAAHTDYKGYPALWAEGGPMVFAWLPRWIDRLDLNGPNMIGRHFLTLVAPHKDLRAVDGHTVYYPVNFEPQMDSSGEQGTMLAHMRMYHGSQTSESLYGRFDPPTMVELRDELRGLMEPILEAVEQESYFGPLFEDGEVEQIMIKWVAFLRESIEPTGNGARAADLLHHKFLQLPIAHQEAWAAGFETTMDMHLDWAAGVRAFLDKYPEYWQMPGIYTEEELSVMLSQ